MSRDLTLFAAVLLAAGPPTVAAAQTGARYLLHFTGVSCVIGPCPGFQVTDRRTGEQFAAVVDFAGTGAPPLGSADLMVDGHRDQRERPGGLRYDVLSVSAIIETIPAVPGYRP